MKINVKEYQPSYEHEVPNHDPKPYMPFIEAVTKLEVHQSLRVDRPLDFDWIESLELYEKNLGHEYFIDANQMRIWRTR